MIRLSAFSDEISPSLDEAAGVLRELSIDHVDLRNVDGTNVVDMSDAQVDDIHRTLAKKNMRVATIATPIGKVKVDSSFAEEWQRFEHALSVATRLSAEFIRVFSYYGPGDGWASDTERKAWLPEVVARINRMDDRAAQTGVTLLVENDSGTLASDPDLMVALLEATESRTVRTAFDPGNFVVDGFTAYPSAFTALRTWIGAVHVKDVDDTRKPTLAGHGLGGFPEIVRELKTDPTDILFSFEPHLAHAGAASGFSGPQRFRDAAKALRTLIDVVAADDAARDDAARDDTARDDAARDDAAQKGSAS